MYFEEHPEFSQTSGIGADRLEDGETPSPRLSNRYLGIVDRNRELFERATVLDIGCHNGRWSMAALDAGAKYVTGLEGRMTAIEYAREALHVAGLTSEGHFVFGDVFETMQREAFKFDLILCLGFMYHTPHHAKLFEHFRRLGKAVILDTKVNGDTRPSTFYMAEPSNMPGCAIPTFGETEVVGVPSPNAVTFLAQEYGFSYEEINWNEVGIMDWRLCDDYRTGKRRSWVLKSIETYAE